MVAFGSAFLSLICGGLVGLGLLVVLQFVQSWGAAATVGLLPLAVILSAAGFLLRSNKAVARLSGDALLALGGMLAGAWFGFIALDYVTLPKGVDDFGYAPLCSGVTGTLVTGILFRRASNPALSRPGKIIIRARSFLLTLVGESLVRESRLASRFDLIGGEGTAVHVIALVFLLVVPAATIFALYRRSANEGCDSNL
jgi:hypothetical protein